MLEAILLLNLFSVCFGLGTEKSSNVQCLSYEGKPVDWFIVYKLPYSAFKKQSFFYMDAERPTWTSSSSTLDKEDNAVYKTLQKIYQKDSEMMYVMYNDQPPHQPSTIENVSSQTMALRFRPTKGIHGHTKGVISFDEDTGFWLIHSAPHFPSPKHKGYHWPSNLKNNGQTFLCISLKTRSALNDIGEQLLYNYPEIYDHALPTNFKSKYPKMAEAVAEKHVTSPPWKRETILTSIAGRKFHSFAKYSDFKADLYGAWLAPRFKQSMLVETWQDGRGKLCSNCTGQYKVYNIKQVRFKEKNVLFSETVDHSKWAVTMSGNSPWTCIGDINRAKGQMTRPGGTVCFQHPQVWRQFRDLMYTDHDCKPYKKCISP